MRQQIRELEKQKKDAKEKLGELLDLTKQGIYRVGTCVINVSLPEEKSITIERVNRPRIRIKDEAPE